MKHVQWLTFVLTAAGLMSVAAAPATAAAQIRPGALGHGATLLVDGRTITPAGRQTHLRELPLNAVLSPNGRDLLITDDGRRTHYLQVISTSTSQVQQSIPYPYPAGLFVGVAYNASGTEAFASGGSQGVIHRFAVASNGTLMPKKDIPVASGLLAGARLAGLASAYAGRLLFVATENPGGLAVIDTSKRKVVRLISLPGRPYGVLATPDSKTVYVSNWSSSSVWAIHTTTDTVTRRIAVGAHPTAMVLSRQGLLYVADSNADRVTVISTGDNSVVGRIDVRPFSGAPLSSSPEGVAVGPDGRYLYVANSGENAVVVFKLTNGGRSAIAMGRIPTAEYPTSVTLGAKGGRLFVTNGDGYGTKPNGNEPSNHYSNTIDGTLSTVVVPDLSHIAAYTTQVQKDNHTGRLRPFAVPATLEPIKHVILVVKQDQSYDQVLGDVKGADGDPALTKYPAKITPNLHALARDFGVFDNFYTDGQTSADAGNWLLSGNANDFDMKMWPQTYGHRERHGYFEGKSRMDLSPGGYLWDRAVQDHVTYRDYGAFTAGPNPDTQLIPEQDANSCAGPIAHSYVRARIPAGKVLCFAPTVPYSTVPNLAGHTDPRYRGFDLRYSDVDRVLEWEREFQGFVRNNNLPDLEILWLPDDHTSTAPGFLSQPSDVALNDEAAGMLVDAVSHSKYWQSTAIFMVQDDAQGSRDHVSAQRTYCLVISPYTWTAGLRVDSGFYNDASLLRTMESILHLQPMSQFDMTASAMWPAFGAVPRPKPFKALPMGIPITYNP